MAFYALHSGASCAACSAAIAASWSAKKKSTQEATALRARTQMRRFEGSLGVLLRQAQSVTDEEVRQNKRKAIRTAKGILSHLPSARTADEPELDSEIGCDTARQNSLFWHSGKTVVSNITRAQHCRDCRSLLDKYASLVPGRHARRAASSKSSFVLLSFEGLVALVKWLETIGEQLRAENAQEYDRVIASWMWCAEEELFLAPSTMLRQTTPQASMTLV